jgi:YD repeat-containing protein
MRCGLMSALAALVLAAAVAATAANAQTQPTISYTYDTLGRLTSATYVGGPNAGLVINYAYDAAGNRTAYQSNGNGNTNHSHFVIIPLLGMAFVVSGK